MKRQDEALRLRRGGLTFSQVGSALGVGRSRAQQLVSAALAREVLAGVRGGQQGCDTPGR